MCTPRRSSRQRTAWPSTIVLVSLALATVTSVKASHTSTPVTVTLAGDLQSELGCPGDWQPECALTRLTYDAGDDVWQGAFAVPAGAWEYKAALNGGWGENYGRFAAPGGANIPLGVTAGATVTFYYDHKTHWIADSVSSVIATVPGSFQSELGCSGDWDPACLRSWVQDPDGDGVYTFSTRDLPAGSYEAKVAIGESWDVNYGAGGVQNGPNIAFTVGGAGEIVTFAYDAVTHVLTITSASTPPQPTSITVAGSLQSELGCPADWQPECSQTHLVFDADDEVWQGTFAVPAGAWEYKAALNGSWAENYGRNALRNGPNVPLALAGAASVKFYYDHATHWVTDNVNSVIATVPGSFQSELGCAGDWDPGCLRSWLQDVDGDGVYTFATRRLPVGTYEAKIAIGETWDLNFGAGGVPNGANIAFSVPTPGAEIFFSWNSTTRVLTISADGAPRGDLTRARAHWVAADLVLWNLAGVDDEWQVALHASPTAGLALDGTGVTGGATVDLTYDAAGPPPDVVERFPHLAAYTAFRLPEDRLADVPQLLKGQLALSAHDAGGTAVDATAVQIPGVLDDLFTYDGPLGPVAEGGAITLRLWAPTAQAVTLRLYGTSDPGALPAAEMPMTLDPATGVWSTPVGSGWYGVYYAYAVRVFTRATNRVETNVVTDPYAVSLSTNSARSQIVSLDDPAFMPAGWSTVAKPALAAPEDITLYELHIRDFSAGDSTVRAPWRGTYLAFTETTSAGMRHLASLAAAGLTHVHLLPSFDIASVNEDRSTWLEPEGDLAAFPPDSPEQQARVEAVADRDGFNWGYDPWHFNAPDGSYATDPDGARRILEFRAMVQGLARAGLRVVTDVVYNHTTASGQNASSVLDRIVPGYYHRLNAEGLVETSTCCQNTATEHAMMEKLMVDSVVLWAKHYKVDGFRFDLMGHHMKRNMLRVRAALDALTLARDGVDGRSIYVYGEGWNFGEVANNARGENAVQLNMAGTGIGSFNDRIRDAARGGGPFSGLQEQGFLTGLVTAPNATDQGSPADQVERLLAYQDRIKVSLAGNLAGVTFVDRTGALVRGDALDYNGSPAGYTADPQETINYIEAHDNETLWDAIQLKAPASLSVGERVRTQMLGMSLVGLGQGVPFFHAGVELLRSKSLDRNSYNSGDWFNRLDFSYETNNWGVGLPRASENAAHWATFGPLLADPALAVAREDIERAVAHLREVLAIRRSSPLFRLRTAQQIEGRVRFLNNGPGQLPGLIAMELLDADGTVDRRWNRVVVVFNAAAERQLLQDATLAGTALALHGLQAASRDPVVRSSSFDATTGTLSVPGRTAAVFVASRPPVERLTLLRQEVTRLAQTGVISRGPATSLSNLLSAAFASASRGDTQDAIVQLQAFVRECEALANAGRLPAPVAAALIADAREIIVLLQSGAY